MNAGKFIETPSGRAEKQTELAAELAHEDRRFNNPWTGYLEQHEARCWKCRNGMDCERAEELSAEVREWNARLLATSNDND